VRGSQRRPATCSFPLAQQRTIELPMMPVMKMARLPLNIAKTSIAAAQHFISEMAAAVIACLGVVMGAVCAPPLQLGTHTPTVSK
jgi:hypothetical protein